MKAFSSLFRTIWLVMFMFVVFGWLVRDRFQLAEELATVSSQNAGLRSQLAQYSNSVAQLQAQLQAAQGVKQELEQLTADYGVLQAQLVGASERVRQLEQQVAAEQNTRIQVENDFALYKTSCDTVKQSVNNDIRLCREMVASLSAEQPSPGASTPPAAEQADRPATILAQAGTGGVLPLGNGNAFIVILILALAITAGAIGVILEKRLGQAGPVRPRRSSPSGRQPLVLRRNAPAPHRPRGHTSRE